MASSALGGLLVIRRCCIALLVGANAVLVALLVAAPGSAHAASVFYSVRWDLDRNVRYYFDPPVPDAFRPEINDGFDTWSDLVDGHAPNFNPGGEEQLSDPFGCEGTTGIFYRNLANDDYGNALAVTTGCADYTQSNLIKFKMVFDSHPSLGPGIDWYVGDGNVPDNRWDLQSIATHEAGHAAGSYGGGHHGHFLGATLCSGSDRQTLCVGSADSVGTKYLRTLEEHDLHTLEDAYETSCPPLCKAAPH
jgi:hypothetical protein